MRSRRAYDDSRSSAAQTHNIITDVIHLRYGVPARAARARVVVAGLAYRVELNVTRPGLR